MTSRSHSPSTHIVQRMAQLYDRASPTELVPPLQSPPDLDSQKLWFIDAMIQSPKDKDAVCIGRKWMMDYNRYLYGGPSPGPVASGDIGFPVDHVHRLVLDQLVSWFGGDRDATASLDRPSNASFKCQEQDKKQCYGNPAEVEEVDEELYHAEKGSSSVLPITSDDDQPELEKEEMIEGALDQVDLELGALMAIHNSVRGEVKQLAVNLHQAQTEFRWGETKDLATFANLKANLKKIKERL